MGKLDGKVALVAGSGRNIGRATVRRLAGESAHVVVNTRSNRDEAEALAAEARALGVRGRREKRPGRGAGDASIGGSGRAHVSAATMGRQGKVEEIAATCLFLVSDDGGFITGQTIHVNGGTGYY